MAGSVFNPDNKFFGFMGKIFDVVVLSLVWLITAIPFPVTFIPATCALYYTVVKNVRKERGYLLKEYFRSFKLNFKYGMFYSLIFSVFGFLLFYIDFGYAKDLTEQGSQYGSMFLGVFIIIALFFFSLLVFLPAVLSRFTGKFTFYFKTSFFMATRHFITSLLLIIIWGVACLGVYIIPALMLFLPALAMLLSSFLIERVFKKYMPKKEEADEKNPDEDHWYLDL
ncbi:MAG: YesL family protein [Lachnospiraceae bacterium]|nr:YesL family protein [Lachnospiraceae bacterium]